MDELINALGAERAILFETDPADPDRLRIRAGRDSNKNDIAELKGYSNTVVRKVGKERKPLIVSGTEDGQALGSESAFLHNLRSILAVPIFFRENFIGVLYLDSTVAKGLFFEEDLKIATALANHIAISLETARAANIEIENRAMKKDLEVTHAVQSLILPKQDTFTSDQVKLASFYKAAGQSGGDWWWYDVDKERGVLTIVLGDVTGHGAGPAMISAVVAGIFQGFNVTRKPGQRISTSSIS